MLLIAICIAATTPVQTPKQPAAPSTTTSAVAAPTTPPPPPTTTTTTTTPTTTSTQALPDSQLTALDIELRPRAAPLTKKPRRFRQHRLEWFPPANSGTPLVLAFDGADAHVDLDTQQRAFTFEPGQAVWSSWPRATTPWLARDVDGDGAVTSGRELFGSFTALGDHSDGGVAHDGFAALAALDDNGDGVVDARDAGFASILVWRDDGDRVSQAAELTSLSSSGVVSIELAHVDVPRCDRVGDCERERATFVYRDARGGEHVGAVVDVHIALRAVQPRS